MSGTFITFMLGAISLPMLAILIGCAVVQFPGEEN